jgi:putative phosphoribosyl transferase
MAMADVVNSAGLAEQVAIPADGVELQGDLVVPRAPLALVAFAHGSGSSRFSSRNRYVAEVLQQAGLATLLFDLLAPDESENSAERFDIPLLRDRLLAAIDWCLQQAPVAGLPLGLFGASTGAAAALEVAAARPECVRAVVSRGGRPDLAFEALGNVRCPTLLIVGSHDVDVLELNAWAAAHLRASHDLLVVTGASHLFSEPGTLEQVAVAARDWFLLQLTPQ